MCNKYLVGGLYARPVWQAQLVWTRAFFFPLSLLISAWIVWPEVSNQSSVFLSLCLFPLEMGSSLVFFFDSLTWCFLFMVCSVSGVVLIYSISYMESSITRSKFMVTMIIFILSMLIMSCSADLFWVMVGWDCLGLSSFLLIVFFNNWSSFNSGVTTFMLNRLGDFFLILAILWALLSGFSMFSTSISTPMFVLLVGATSKSAQIPYSSWLPLAMAAPTPVSALVHSSTLVAAGVYIVLRFHLFLSSLDLMYLKFVSVVTVILAFSSSVSETDMKKIIAFSTMSHVGMILFFLSTNMIVSAKVHMIIHAFFKSSLFMVAGLIIHMNFNSQDIRRDGVVWQSFPVSVTLMISLFGMIGAPFMSGFMSKELLIVSSSQLDKMPDCLFILFCVMSSSIYSFRMLGYFFNSCKVCSISLSRPIEWGVMMLSIFLVLLSGGLIPTLCEDLPPIGFISKELKLMSFSLLLFSSIIGWAIIYIPSLKISKLMNLTWGSVLFVQSSKLTLYFSKELLSNLDFMGALDRFFIGQLPSLNSYSSEVLKLSYYKFLFVVWVIIFLSVSIMMMW